MAAVFGPLAALVLGTLLALAVSAPVSHAAPRAAMDPAGSISGVVTNGTHSGAPAAGQQVTLRAIVLDRPRDAGIATTNAQGHFSFGGLDTSGETTYEVYTHYQGGFFISAPVSFGGSATPAQTTTLAIYDTMSDMTALRVSNLTVLISAVNKDKGLIPVGMFYTFANTGTRAIAGSLNPPAGGGMPQGVLRFALPTSATNLTLGAGFADAQTMQIGTGFAATATIPPGFASFAFAFDLPYTGTSATLPLSAQYLTGRLAVLAPPAYRITAPGFATDTPLAANGQQFQQLHVDNLAAGGSKQIALAALPEAGVDPDLRFGQVLPIAAVLALLLALLLWLFAIRGDLGALRRLAGQPTRGRRGDVRRVSSQTQTRNVARQRLLDALLDLDERHAAATIDAAAYERRRAELRTELRALLAAGVLTPQPPLPAGRGGAREGTGNAEARGEGEQRFTTEETEEAEGRAEGKENRSTAEGAVGINDRGAESDSVEVHGVPPDLLNADGDSVGASTGRPARDGDSVAAHSARPPAVRSATPSPRREPGKVSATPSPRRERGPGGEDPRARRSRATAGGGQ